MDGRRPDWTWMRGDSWRMVFGPRGGALYGASCADRIGCRREGPASGKVEAPCFQERPRSSGGGQSTRLCLHGLSDVVPLARRTPSTSTTSRPLPSTLRRRGAAPRSPSLPRRRGQGRYQGLHDNDHPHRRGETWRTTRRGGWILKGQRPLPFEYRELKAWPAQEWTHGRSSSWVAGGQPQSWNMFRPSPSSFPPRGRAQQP